MSRAVSLKRFKLRVLAWQTKLCCEPRQVMVMPMKRKWASCSSKRRVCFAHDVIGLPESLQDYIIVHELIHLKHPNHGRVFRSLLKANLPNWEILHNRLRDTPRD